MRCHRVVKTPLEILKKFRERRKLSPQKLLFGSDQHGFMIEAIKAVPSTSGKIVAIRVQDISRQLWFNWDYGVWDTLPSCVPGAGNLYIAFYAENEGSPGNLTLYLSDNAGILNQKVGYADLAGAVGLEWTGNMPTTTYAVSCQVTP